MHDRTNTIAGWVLAAGIAALGLSVVSGKLFHADEYEAPGFVIEGGGEAGGGDAGPSFTALLAAADVGAGEQVFKKCTACHTINAGGANGIGPNLYGVVGKSHAAVSGFDYSPALSAISGPWTFDELDAWLKSPRKYATGNKMSFAGLSKAEDRANVIAYMNAQGSNLPLPAPPPPEEEAPAEGEDGTQPATEEGAAIGDGEVPAGTIVEEAATSNE